MTTPADGAVRVCGTEYQGLEPVLGVKLSPEEGLVRRLSEARPELVQVDQLEQDGAAREDQPRARAPAGCFKAATPGTVRPERSLNLAWGLVSARSPSSTIFTPSSTRKRWEASPAPLMRGKPRNRERPQRVRDAAAKSW